MQAGDGVGCIFLMAGNTESVAAEIQNQTGADIFRLVPAEPYTDDYDALLDIAQEEQRNGARPAISGSIENFDSYEVVYLGYPNWWGDMPMSVYTFIEKHDWQGKTVIPFCTHEGSGLSDTENKIKKACNGAIVLNGLAIRGTTAQKSQEQARKTTIDWLANHSK